MRCSLHETTFTEGQACPTCYEGRVELIDQRERKTKVYALPSGDIVREESSLYPRHWWDGDRWVDYAPVWTEGDGWTLTGMNYTVRVPAGDIGYTMTLGERSATCVMAEPALWTVPEVIERRLFWDFGNLTIYLIPHYDGVSTHYIFRDSLAPRRFVWHQTGDMAWHVGGRDNLDRSEFHGRDIVNMTRPLVVSHEASGTRHVLEWTGQVVALDERRRMSYSDAVVYPARMKH